VDLASRHGSGGRRDGDVLPVDLRDHGAMDSSGRQRDRLRGAAALRYRSAAPIWNLRQRLWWCPAAKQQQIADGSVGDNPKVSLGDAGSIKAVAIAQARPDPSCSCLGREGAPSASRLPGGCSTLAATARALLIGGGRTDFGGHRERRAVGVVPLGVRANQHRRRALQLLGSRDGLEVHPVDRRPADLRPGAAVLVAVDPVDHRLDSGTGRTSALTGRVYSSRDAHNDLSDDNAASVCKSRVAVRRERFRQHLRWSRPYAPENSLRKAFHPSVLIPQSSLRRSGRPRCWPRCSTPTRPTTWRRTRRNSRCRSRASGRSPASAKAPRPVPFRRLGPRIERSSA
jgi:hypothetical protein